MKSYLIVTGLIFALIVVAHIARVVVEGAALLAQPWFLILTLLAFGMFAWTLAVYRKM